MVRYPNQINSYLSGINRTVWYPVPVNGYIVGQLNSIELNGKISRPLGSTEQLDIPIN
jgi:hypothetical protein